MKQPPDIPTCLRTARSSGAFTDTEIAVLEDVLLSYQQHPGRDYVVLSDSCRGVQRGFVVFGRNPMARRGWDLYWIVVDRASQRRGVGRRLLDRMLRFIARRQPGAIIKVETAGRPDYQSSRSFYRAAGFVEGGRVPDFYAAGDDLVIFWKKAAGP